MEIVFDMAVATWRGQVVAMQRDVLKYEFSLAINRRVAVRLSLCETLHGEGRFSAWYS
jgi:hypothetical protein